ncbi:hypothetical protein MN608_02345 [Microdochium nivale]|nr:hypothetical protein MN608_02345 [Microdochium nivale]
MLRSTISNEVPMLFWMVVQKISRPEVLVRLRQEAEDYVFPPGAAVDKDERLDSGNDEEGPGQARGRGLIKPYEMTWLSIKVGCLLLRSYMKKTQRVASVGIFFRQVVEDTVLTDETAASMS